MGLGQKHKTLPEKQVKAKEGWGHGSSGKEPA
jgi:hypothetical protein